MKLLSALIAAVCLAAACGVDAKQPKNEPLEPTAPTTPPKIQAIDAYPVADHQAPNVVTTTDKKDKFSAVAATEPVVGDIVGRFMTLYAKEMGRASLKANVSSVIKAERTDVRAETIEKELDVDGLGMNFVEEAQSQQYRIFLLMAYQFESTMTGRNRPYVTVMRLSMDCYNTTSDAAVDAAEAAATNDYDDATVTDSRLACDVLEHMDLPRRNESTKKIPSYIQREIYNSAPSSYIHNHTLNVFYDAVEAQDLSFDADTGEAIANNDTMHYVRFRVQGGTAKDCVIAIEHTNGFNTLRYHDTVCYDEPTDEGALIAAATGGSRFAVTKENAPMFVLIASVAGACVAMVLLWRQRQRQRSGYSYLHSNTSKLSHVPVPSTGTTNTDAAVAC